MDIFSSSEVATVLRMFIWKQWLVTVSKKHKGTTDRGIIVIDISGTKIHYMTKQRGLYHIAFDPNKKTANNDRG